MRFFALWVLSILLENFMAASNVATIVPIKPSDILEDTDSPSIFDTPVEIFRQQLMNRKKNQEELATLAKTFLIENEDYGSIKTKRGLTRPTLLKNGAEKLCNLLGLRARFPNLAEYERAALSGIELQHLILRCELVDSQNRVVAEGVGGRSTIQDMDFNKKPDWNKLMKMLQKSAHIDAVIRCAGISFAQEQEDEEKITSPQITSEQLSTLLKQLKISNVDLIRYTNWVNKVCESKQLPPITDLSQMPSTIFNGCMAKIESFAPAK
jgi:hypothetical protein